MVWTIFYSDLKTEHKNKTLCTRKNYIIRKNIHDKYIHQTYIPIHSWILCAFMELFENLAFALLCFIIFVSKNNKILLTNVFFYFCCYSFFFAELATSKRRIERTKFFYDALFFFSRFYIIFYFICKICQQKMVHRNILILTAIVIINFLKCLLIFNLFFIFLGINGGTMNFIWLIKCALLRVMDGLGAQ